MHKFILVAITLLLLAGPAQAVLQPEPSRFDLDNQQPGALIERSLTIRNQADTAAAFDLQVIRFQNENVTILPSQLQLGPGASGQIHVTIRLADDAAGGRHDIRITATEGASQTANGVGARSAVRMPIIFHVENLKLASLEVQDALPDEHGQATAMVFNHLRHEANTTLHLLIRDQAGHDVLRFQSAAEDIRPEEHRFLTLPIHGLPGGVYTVEAWADHAGGASNRMTGSYTVGVKAMTVSSARVEPLGDGLYRLAADFSSAGTIAFEIETAFRIAGPDGLEQVAAPTYTLDAAESVAGSITVRLEPGLHEITALASWDSGQASSPPTSYTASKDDQPAQLGSQEIPWPYVIGMAGIVAGLAIALVRRRRGS